MAGKTFVIVDRASLDSALAEADAKDSLIVAKGAFDATPRLAVDGARWRLNGWAALPAVASTVTVASPVSYNYAGYVTTWAALARVFADTMGPARRSSPVSVPPVTAYVVPDRPIISYLAAYAQWVALHHKAVGSEVRPTILPEGL